MPCLSSLPSSLSWNLVVIKPIPSVCSKWVRVPQPSLFYLILYLSFLDGDPITPYLSLILRSLHRSPLFSIHTPTAPIQNGPYEADRP